MSRLTEQARERLQQRPQDEPDNAVLLATLGARDPEVQKLHGSFDPVNIAEKVAAIDRQAIELIFDNPKIAKNLELGTTSLREWIQKALNPLLTLDFERHRPEGNGRSTTHLLLRFSGVTIEHMTFEIGDLETSRKRPQETDTRRTKRPQDLLVLSGVAARIRREAASVSAACTERFGRDTGINELRENPGLVGTLSKRAYEIKQEIDQTKALPEKLR